MTVFVSGAAGNLGSAVISALKNRGFHSIGAGRSKPDNFFGDAFYESDLGSEEAVNLLFKKVRNDWPDLNGAVFTAGGYIGGNISELRLNSLEDQIRLNFNTTMLPAIQILNFWKEKGISGRMVFSGSTPGADPAAAASAAAYGLSKSLLFHFSGMINESVKNFGIRSAVAVIPAMATSQNKQFMTPGEIEKLVSPASVAERMLDFITGHSEEERIIW